MYTSGCSRDHTARVLNDVAGTGAALDRDVAETRVDSNVDSVEVVERAADVVGERQEVIDLLELARFHVTERQWVAAAAREAGIAWHVVDECIEVGRRPCTVDRDRQVSPAPANVVHFD